MSERDTKMGGACETFPETVWSVILLGPDDGSPARRAALTRFATLYWRPVYRFIRCWGKSVEDAKDLTQSFFCHLLEAETIARYQKEQGRFRPFLKGVLRLFLAETERGARCQKRGGGLALLSLDVADLESDRALQEASGQRPEAIFDRQWVNEVLTDSLARLRVHLTRDGKETWLRVYEAYELGTGGAAPTYDEVARRFGLGPHDVKNCLQHVRGRLRALVLETLAHTASSREEVLAELAEVLSE